MAGQETLCYSIWVMLYLFLLHLQTQAQMNPHRQEFCDDEDFTARCNPGEVIVMEEALFGRMKLGKCIAQDYGHLGCGENVLTKMDNLCSGKQNCQILKLGGVDFPHVSCGDLKLHLEVEYRCTPAIQGTALQSVCAQDDNLITMHNSHLSVFNGDIQTLNCLNQGSHIHFKVRVSMGQHISVTLLDFEIDRQSPGNTCQNYGTVTESHIQQKFPICGGRERRIKVLESNSNQIEIQLGKSKSRFALEFQTLGCPDLSAPVHGWIKRDKHKVSVGCYSPQQTWHLTCRNNHWSGVVGNCSSGTIGVNLGKSSQVNADSTEAYSDVFLALIIAGAITLSVAAVTLAIVCWKRKTVGLEAARLKASQQQILKAPLPDSDYMHPSLIPRSTVDETEDAVYDFCFAPAPTSPAPIPNNIAVTLPCRGNNFQYNNTRAPDSPKYKTLIFVNQ